MKLSADKIFSLKLSTSLFVISLCLSKSVGGAQALSEGPLSKGPLSKGPLSKGPLTEKPLSNDPLSQGGDFLAPPEVKAAPEEKEFFDTPKATKIDPQFFVLPALPPPPPVEEKKKVDKPFFVKIDPPPIRKETPKPPELPPVRRHNVRQSLLAQQAKDRLEERRRLQQPLRVKVKRIPEHELLYAKDPHYRTWDQRVGEERLTYPVDRDWVFTRERIITGILKTGIRSTVGGQVIMVIDRDHFAAKGWKVILPKGTEMICSYQTLQNVKDRQVPFRCHEAIRPDGARLLFDSHGQDASGYPGLVGEIDFRTIERYGAAFTMSGVAALADASSARFNRNHTMQNTSTQLSNNLGQVTADVIDQNLDLTPVITIEPGTRVNIQPTTDIWLRPPLSRQEVEAMKRVENQQYQQKQQNQQPQQRSFQSGQSGPYNPVQQPQQSFQSQQFQPSQDQPEQEPYSENHQNQSQPLEEVAESGVWD